MSMAGIGSTVGHRSMRKDQAGAHGCVREDHGLRLMLNNLEDKRTFMLKSACSTIGNKPMNPPKMC